MTKYQFTKVSLKIFAKQAKETWKNDKPLIRMLINDEVDSLSKENNLSEYERGLLSNYACKLHPKN